jgi:spore maturation protein CgeB
MALIDGLSSWCQFLTNHFYVGAKVREINRRVLERGAVVRPDLLWVDKGLHLWPETLARLRADGCRWLVHYSPDNQMIASNQSRHYLRSIPLYDVHVTTKTHNIDWLKRLGARRVELAGKGFDPELHYPVSLNPDEEKRYQCEVGFVGHWEPTREALLVWLSEQGFQIKVWGGSWERARRREHPLFREAVHLRGPEYTRALCGARINLCLVSEWFGDQTTARSVEIPASGGFMLAERTPEHAALFQEGSEAEFYGSRTELVDKIRFYLNHEEKRRAVAAAGRRRCMEHYSNEQRLRDVLDRILKA